MNNQFIFFIFLKTFLEPPPPSQKIGSFGSFILFFPYKKNNLVYILWCHFLI